MSGLGVAEKSLIGLFLALPALVLAAYGVRVAVAGRALDPRVQRESSTVLLGRFPIEAFHWALRGVGRSVSRTGVSPDTLPARGWTPVPGVGSGVTGPPPPRQLVAV